MTALAELDVSQAVAALRAGEILCEDYQEALQKQVAIKEGLGASA